MLLIIKEMKNLKQHTIKLKEEILLELPENQEELRLENYQLLLEQLNYYLHVYICYQLNNMDYKIKKPDIDKDI